jgi:Integrase core domain/Winged helix-turn helix
MSNEEKIIKNKLGLLELSKHLGNVSRACKIFGYSRDSFYRFKKLYEEGGETALMEMSRKKANIKNRVAEDVEQAVVKLAVEYPAYGQVRAANELKKRNIFLSPGGVRNVWLRHNMETFKKRLDVLEEKMAKENLILTEAQVVAMERRKENKEAIGEIETEHPGYLGAQDTYYVGNLKGVGRIYQQTFIDTYTRVAQVKLYDRKNALVAADLLNDRVLPFFEAQEIPLLRILTDRGTEFCGKPEYHEYELYLAVENIDHSKTKARHPQTNGICERFHKTILTEFYQITFRKKIYTKLEDLQNDLDLWIKSYNEERPHSGRFCDGRTPMETFLQTKHLAKNKMLGYNIAVNS